ncbi:hypothetical protein ACGFNU_21440 [Spirillospora sp. NPDC048911]|uniref:hypothetical protein n=1 Tax=Spirillospora sp. NPDC048911 TaxID=3364527 RepID=UPI00371A595D
MNQPDETIAAIDAAIDGYTSRDWAVSKDAMRWSAEPPALTPGRVFTAPVGTSLDSSAWTDIGSLLADDGIDFSGEDIKCTITVDTTRFMEMLRGWPQHIQMTVRAVGKQAFQASRAMHVATAPQTYGSGYRKHRARCRACNPAANPKPLKVNGADYTRRRKNRIRRGR